MKAYIVITSINIIKQIRCFCRYTVQHNIATFVFIAYAQKAGNHCNITCKQLSQCYTILLQYCKNNDITCKLQTSSAHMRTRTPPTKSAWFSTLVLESRRGKGITRSCGIPGMLTCKDQALKEPATKHSQHDDASSQVKSSNFGF